MNNKNEQEEESIEEVVKRSQAELDVFKRQISAEERKRIEKEIADERNRLVRFYRRNLTLALRLRPKVIQIRHELGMPDNISEEEYQTWKLNHSLEIRDALDRLLQEHHILSYQMPVINWMFDATDSQLEELRAFLKNPDEERKLRAEYVKVRNKQYIKEYEDSHFGQLPPGKEIRNIDEQAAKYFDTREVTLNEAGFILIDGVVRGPGVDEETGEGVEGCISIGAGCICVGAEGVGTGVGCPEDGEHELSTTKTLVMTIKADHHCFI